MSECTRRVPHVKPGGRICTKQCYCSLEDQENCMNRIKFYRGLQKPHLDEKFVKGYCSGVEMVMTEMGFDFSIIHEVMMELSEKREEYLQNAHITE